MTSQPKRRWQFGLRDLAWLMVVVALGLAWHLDRQASLRREAEAKAGEKEARDYAAQIIDDGHYVLDLYQKVREQNAQLLDRVSTGQ